MYRNGIKNDGIYENLNKVKKIEKFLLKSKIAEQNILLENILKSYGYYFVRLETKIIQIILLILFTILMLEKLLKSKKLFL